MSFGQYLFVMAIIFAIILLWAALAKLDLGLERPNYRRAEPWVLLFILWGIAEWAVAIVLPVEPGPDAAAKYEDFTLFEFFILIVILAPVVEELLFRGVIFASLVRRFGIVTAVLVPSLIFGLLHFENGWWGVLWLSGVGVLLAMIRWKSGSLLLPIVLHAAWNLQLLLYGLLTQTG